jgi:hypothetical protein
MTRIHLTAMTILACMPLCASAQDCTMPDSGTWKLDTDHFATTLGKGDAAAVAQIRDAFASANSMWIFDGNRAVFSMNGYDQVVEMQTLQGCRLIGTTQGPTSKHSEEYAFFTSENRLCFVLPVREGGTREECYVREQ